MLGKKCVQLRTEWVGRWRSEGFSALLSNGGILVFSSLLTRGELDCGIFDRVYTLTPRSPRDTAMHKYIPHCKTLLVLRRGFTLIRRVVPKGALAASPNKPQSLCALLVGKLSAHPLNSLPSHFPRMNLAPAAGAAH